MTIEAYPLAWPDGRPRTDRWRREDSRFRMTFARARDDVARQIGMLTGGRGEFYQRQANIVISTNLALRRDGLPLAAQRQPDDPGVAVYFKYKNRQMCFACDRWKRIEDNMQAVAKTIEALRGVARWGTGDMMEAAFTGFTALPSPEAAHIKEEWWQVLGIAQRSLANREVVRDKWMRLRSVHHPDRGGDAHTFIRVEAAYKQGCRELGINP